MLWIELFELSNNRSRLTVIRSIKRTQFAKLNILHLFARDRRHRATRTWKRNSSRVIASHRNNARCAAEAAHCARDFIPLPRNERNRAETHNHGRRTRRGACLAKIPRTYLRDIPVHEIGIPNSHYAPLPDLAGDPTSDPTIHACPRNSGRAVTRGSGADLPLLLEGRECGWRGPDWRWTRLSWMILSDHHLSLRFGLCRSSQRIDASRLNVLSTIVLQAAKFWAWFLI